MKGVNGYVSPKTAYEFDQALSWMQWVWEETRGDYYSYEYRQAEKRYDDSLARWNQECRGEV